MTVGEAVGKDDYLTTKQVAQEYPFEESTLRWMRHTNQGPASFVIGKRRIVYRRSEIERFIAAQEATTTRGGEANE